MNDFLEDERKRYAMGLAIIIILLFTLSTLLNGLNQETVYIKQGNIYKGFFTEPIETLLFIFKDGDFMTFTNYYESRVKLSIWWLKEYLKKNDKKISDIVIAIHNHNKPYPFSESNHRYYRTMKQYGFKGYFCIYYPATDTVRILEE